MLLEMSRTPIREAITQLRQEWLVEVAAQSGTKVSLISHELIREGYSTRLLIESSILKDYAGKLKNDERIKLANSLEKQEQAKNLMQTNPDLFIRLDDEFHHLLYEFAGRKYTLKAIKGLISHYDRARYLAAMEGISSGEKNLNDHKKIYSYMLMGLPPDIDAYNVMLHHLGHFGNDLFSLSEKYNKYFI